MITIVIMMIRIGMLKGDGDRDNYGGDVGYCHGGYRRCHDNKRKSTKLLNSAASQTLQSYK